MTREPETLLDDLDCGLSDYYSRLILMLKIRKNDGLNLSIAINLFGGNMNAVLIKIQCKFTHFF